MTVHFAWLAELSQGCRQMASAAVRGHAVLQTGPGSATLHLHLTGLRQLGDRRPPGTLFYETWHLPSNGNLQEAVSLGIFNANPIGAVSVNLTAPSSLRGDRLMAELPGSLVLITAQANDGTLVPSSQAVLLGVFGMAAPEPAVVQFHAGMARTAPSPQGPSAPVPPATLVVPVTDSPEPVRYAPEPAFVESEAALVEPQAMPNEPETILTEPEPVVVEPEPALPRSAAIEPAPTRGWTFPVDLANVPRTCPPGHRLLIETSGALIPLLPDLRQTTGNLNVHFEQGLCLVTIRDVPPPATWGQDAITRRPFNVYQAWLRRGRTDEVVPLGFFRRIWQDTYRLQYRGRLPLHAFDTVAVSAADRAGAAYGSGPLLFVGTYQQSLPG